MDDYYLVHLGVIAREDGKPAESLMESAVSTQDNIIRNAITAEILNDEVMFKVQNQLVTTM